MPSAVARGWPGVCAAAALLLGAAPCVKPMASNPSDDCVYKQLVLDYSVAVATNRSVWWRDSVSGLVTAALQAQAQTQTPTAAGASATGGGGNRVPATPPGCPPVRGPGG